MTTILSFWNWVLAWFKTYNLLNPKIHVGIISSMFHIWCKELTGVHPVLSSIMFGFNLDYSFFPILVGPQKSKHFNIGSKLLVSLKNTNIKIIDIILYKCSFRIHTPMQLLLIAVVKILATFNQMQANYIAETQILVKQIWITKQCNSRWPYCITLSQEKLEKKK